MVALRHGNFRLAAVLSVAVLGLALAGCSGDDGNDGAQGPAGQPGADGSNGFNCWDLNENGIPDFPEEDLNGDGEINVLDCNALANQTVMIGNGSELTEEQIEELGQLQATITGVTVSSPPVVNFTVTDSHGRPAVGLAPGVVQFTFAKLVPGDPSFNGGIGYWQSYVNRVANTDGGALPTAIQATTDRSGELVELGFGDYQYTFATDVTNVTDPYPVAWEPSLTHRVGLEIRLDPPAETPLAPNNPTFDFVPDGGAGSGFTKDIADTANCDTCHYQFALHGGPRKTVNYCVTCHNPYTTDPDSGNSVDMAYLAHSIHPGLLRGELECNPGREDPAAPDYCTNSYPYIIYGFGGNEHNYSETTYPQDLLYCGKCHHESDATPDGDVWNTEASTKTCGGCHAGGIVASNPDPVTGIYTYAFDHNAAGADIQLGAVPDGECTACHIGQISTAGPPAAIHANIRGSQRRRNESGDNFVFRILGATNTAPGETPVITFRIDDPEGNPYDIVNDPEFTDSNAALNLYVAWPSTEIYNGDEMGNTGGARDRGPVIGVVEPYGPGHPYRMELAALQDQAAQNADGSYTVTYFKALPTDYTGDVMIALGGHPAWSYTDADGVTGFDRAAAVSATFFPAGPTSARAKIVDSENCNACHERLSLHGGNRNGNVEICVACHNPDTAVAGEGWAFGRLVHAIHSASPTFAGGEFAEVTYPQSEANCDTCHQTYDEEGDPLPPTYNTARANARATSTNAGADPVLWTDDIATTPNASYCGVCHFEHPNPEAIRGHFLTQGAQIDVVKTDIVGGDVGRPNGMEACAVCHGTGSSFEAAKFHNPGLEE